jgi:hypothetical protein
MSGQPVTARFRSRHLPLALVVTLLAGAVQASPVEAVEATSIGPNQFFVGKVNGVTTDARIKVDCDGDPEAPGATGHPVTGQTVSASQVTPPTNLPQPGVGFTGSAGEAVGVVADPSNPTTFSVIISAYDALTEVPTSITVPCGGFGSVVFQGIHIDPNPQSTVHVARHPPTSTDPTLTVIYDGKAT